VTDNSEQLTGTTEYLKVCKYEMYKPFKCNIHRSVHRNKRGLLEKYPTFGREKETGLLGALDT
jgi:hypothetical protein